MANGKTWQSVYLDKTLQEDLKKISAKEKRPVNQIINFAIEEYVKKNK